MRSIKTVIAYALIIIVMLGLLKHGIDEHLAKWFIWFCATVAFVELIAIVLVIIDDESCKPIEFRLHKKSKPRSKRRRRRRRGHL